MVAKPVGSRGLCFGADTAGALDDGSGATSNVMWQVAPVGAGQYQALEKLLAVHPCLGGLGPLIQAGTEDLPGVGPANGRGNVRPEGASCFAHVFHHLPPLAR
jgi:hypothetical protein